MILKSGAWPAHRPVGTGLQILGSSKRAQVLRVMVRSVRISHECNQQNLYKQERFRIFGNESSNRQSARPTTGQKAGYAPGS